MNMYVVSIAVVMLLILLIFGHVSPEEAKKQRMKRGGDALIEAIEEYNSKSHSLRGLNPGSATRPNNMVGSNRNAPRYPSYMNSNKNSEYPDTQQNAPANANPVDDDNYYPPPPISAPAQLPNGQPHSRATPSFQLPMGLVAASIPPYYLRSGQKIGFAGPTVFTFNDKGDPMPMPDGTYSMMNGRVNLVVRNGRKFIMNN